MPHTGLGCLLPVLAQLLGLPLLRRVRRRRLLRLHAKIISTRALETLRRYLLGSGGLGPALADDATSLAFTLMADICTLLLLRRLPVRLGLSDPVQKTTYIVAVQQRSRSCSPCATRRACRLPGGHVRVSRVLGCCPTRRGADVVAFIS
jgi:hypothetical protein